MATKVKGIPEGYHTITPSLAIRDAARALDFYKKAFGAEERFRMPGPDGKSASTCMSRTWRRSGSGR
jgi:PhnB protein